MSRLGLLAATVLLLLREYSCRWDASDHTYSGRIPFFGLVVLCVAFLTYRKFRKLTNAASSPLKNTPGMTVNPAEPALDRSLKFRIALQCLISWPVAIVVLILVSQVRGPAHSGVTHLVGLVPLGMGMIVVYGAFLTYRKYRLLRSAPQMPIGSLATAGTVHIYGRAVGTERLTSPITRLPCFCYEVVVKAHSTGEGAEWAMLLHDIGHTKFQLQDATGKVTIDPHEAERELSQTFQAEIGPRASKKRTVDPALAWGNGPADGELLEYLHRTNAKIHAELSRST